MVFLTFSVDDIVFIHDKVITPNELQGLALNKSLDAALSRIDYRLHYGLIKDVYDLAATYAVVIARGHAFNDANKRTAYRTMLTCLAAHGKATKHLGDEETGALMVEVAQGTLDEIDLAMWLRNK